jgi:glucokinase
MIIQPDGPLCSCGSRGCLETFSSERAIIHSVKHMLEQGRSSKLGTIAEKNELNGEEIISAAEQGDEVALKAVQSACKYLAIGLINLIRLLDPATIRIMNSISESDELLKKLIFKYVNEYSLGNYEWNTQIEFETNKYICLDGAATLVLDDMFTNVRDKFLVTND